MNQLNDKSSLVNQRKIVPTITAKLNKKAAIPKVI